LLNLYTGLQLPVSTVSAYLTARHSPWLLRPLTVGLPQTLVWNDGHK